MLLKTAQRDSLREVDLENCISPFGFSFGKGGWHHLVEYLKEIDRDPTTPLQKTFLYRYHNTYKPKSMLELVHSAGMNTQFDPGFMRYPWGNFTLHFDHQLPQKNNLQSRFCGPTSIRNVESESMQLIQLRDSMRQFGYNPWRYPNSFIGGVFLIRNNSDHRFVVLQGNHRVAVLHSLGVEQFIVRFLPRHIHYIYRDDVLHWYYVKQGLCPVEEALKYFDAFFILDGTERAKDFKFI